MIYRTPTIFGCLEQGDVLKRTDALVALLKEYHPYYADHNDNKLFVVLTQSCDLVPRPDGCNARYITIAPLRPLNVILQREFEDKFDNMGKGGKPFTTNRVRTGIEQFLHRLFNNNEPSFFYYQAEHSSGIYTDMCALLGLAISFKAHHYKTMLDAKIIGIEDVFQAKLGWLIGAMYSRVGTPDFEETARQKKVQEHLKEVAIWLPEKDHKILLDLVEEFKTVNNADVVGATDLGKLIQKIPKPKSRIIDVVLDMASAQGLFGTPSKERLALRRALEGSTDFAEALR